MRDDSEGKFPRFVRVQVDDRDRGYRVNLYDINYRTWDVRCIWQGPKLSAFGVMHDMVHCWSRGGWNRDGWFRVDAATGDIRKDMPFIPSDVDGAYWLVSKPGEKRTEWSYDPAKKQFVAQFASVKLPPSGDTQVLLSPDARSRAWILVPLPSGRWQGGIVKGTMILQRDGHKSDICIPVRLYAAAGSGRPVIPLDTNLKFTGDGRVEFSATTNYPGTNERVWSIVLTSGKVTESVRPHPAPTPPDWSMFHGVPTPEYLPPYLEEYSYIGRPGLAVAFLKHLGLLERREGGGFVGDYSGYPGVSNDGRHILCRLVKSAKGELADVFIYADLQTQKTIHWECPEGLKKANMDFVWVETP